MRKFVLLVFTVLFAVETFIIRGVDLTPLQWGMLALSASMIGRACAYLAILEWLRFPFVKVVPHSSGAGEDNQPRWTTGALSAIAELICCPVCAGTWGAAGLLTIFKYEEEWGYTLLFVLSAASVAWFITYLTQLIEWHTHLARERVAYFKHLRE